jgi:hypothetical protein
MKIKKMCLIQNIKLITIITSKQDQFNITSSQEFLKIIIEGFIKV